MTFGVVIYSLAGSLIPVRLWVFTCVSYVVIATHAGRAGTMCVLKSAKYKISYLVM